MATTADAPPMSPESAMRIPTLVSTTPAHDPPQTLHFASPDSTVSSSSKNEIENKYSFTPNRLPAPKPRAWQRQPSQPFAPRHGGQKIWRRAPLRNISDEVNRRWKRGSEEGSAEDANVGDGVVRPAKRMRVLGAQGKENEEVEMTTGGGWGMTAEGAEEVAQILQVDEKDAGQESPHLNDDLRSNHDVEGDNLAGVRDHQNEVSPPAMVQVGFGQLDDASTGEQYTPGADHPLSALSSFPQPLTSERDDDVSPASVSDSGAKLSKESANAEPEKSLDNDESTDIAPLSPDQSNDIQEQSSTVESRATPSVMPAADSTAPPEMCFDVTPTVPGDQSSSVDPDAEVEDDSSGSFVDRASVFPDETHNPAQTSLAPSETTSLSPALTKEAPNNGPSTTFSAPQSTRLHLQPEEDDTAFLQQFLQRAKQAREKNPTLQLYRPVGEQVKRHLIDQQNQSVSPQKKDRKRPRSPEPEDLSNLDNAEDATVTTTVLIANLDNNTGKPPSPSRRSNRLSANTKLPRPLRPTALPSNISLRRLNGTEFISMAKQRSEAQSVANTTRNHTRRNKGSALNVQDRLEQIRLGFQDQASTGDVPQPERKQKPRVRKKTGVLYDRVGWSNKIARYREDDGEEHTLTVDGEARDSVHKKDHPQDDDDDDDNDFIPPPPKTSAVSFEELKELSGKSTSTSKKTRSSSSASSRSENRTSKSKSTASIDESTEAEPATPATKAATKRKRKETTGTVNGTPAPKRGMDVMLESARDNEGVATALGKPRRDDHSAMAGAEASTPNASGNVEEDTAAETRVSKRLRLRQGKE